MTSESGSRAGLLGSQCLGNFRKMRRAQARDSRAGKREIPLRGAAVLSLLAGSERRQKWLLGNVVPKARGKGFSQQASLGQAAGRGRAPSQKVSRGSLQTAPLTHPHNQATSQNCKGGATYLSAEKLPDQGGRHLLHEEAVHAPLWPRGRSAADPDPGSVAASMAALPWRRCQQGRGTPPLPWE